MPYYRESVEILLPSAARGTGTTNVDIMIDPKVVKGALFLLNITAVSGTPTLDIKLQWQDPIVAATYQDIPSASFAQKTTTGQDALLIYPGTVETANKRVSQSLGGSYRLVATVAGTTPSFTFTVSVVYLSA